MSDELLAQYRLCVSERSYYAILRFTDWDALPWEEFVKDICHNEGKVVRSWRNVGPAVVAEWREALTSEKPVPVHLYGLSEHADRNKNIVDRWNAGETLNSIAIGFSMTKERVRQIIMRSKYRGVAVRKSSYTSTKNAEALEHFNQLRASGSNVTLKEIARLHETSYDALRKYRQRYDQP